MIKVNLVEFKVQFAKILKKVEQGETVVLARRNRGRRPIGLCAGDFIVPEDFDAPLPEEALDAFEGR